MYHARSPLFGSGENGDENSPGGDGGMGSIVEVRCGIKLSTAKNSQRAFYA